jgi:hypothetical protein
MTNLQKIYNLFATGNTDLALLLLDLQNLPNFVNSTIVGIHKIFAKNNMIADFDHNVTIFENSVETVVADRKSAIAMYCVDLLLNGLKFYVNQDGIMSTHIDNDSVTIGDNHYSVYIYDIGVGNLNEKFWKI